jgi:hypothetical protein
MPSYVGISAFISSAPPAHKDLFDDHDVLPLYRRWYEEEAFVTHIFRYTSLLDCLLRPYGQSGDDFVKCLREQRNDVKELVCLKEGLWLYYEGIAGD